MAELSPAAQEVLDATFDYWPGGQHHPNKRVCLAAALRAATDQVVPGDGSRRANEIRSKFLAIATELENHQ